MSTAKTASHQEFASCWIGQRLLPIANAAINSFKAHGHQYTLYAYGAVADVPPFVRCEDAEDLSPQKDIHVAHGGFETAADKLAYRFLAKYGGWFVDNDVVCNADEVPDCPIAFAQERPGIINNAVLKFPAGHGAVRDLLDYVATVDPATSIWGSTGPLALSRVFRNRRDLIPYQLPTAAIYPLHWTEAPKLLFPEFEREVLERTAASPFIHLWGSTIREIGFDLAHWLPLEGSYLSSLYSRCLDPNILSRLSPVNEAEFRRSVERYVTSSWNVSLNLT